MLGLIKSLIYLNVITVLGAALFFSCVKKPIRLRFQNKFISVLLYSNTIAFLSPNIIIHEIFSFLMLPIFCQRKDQILPIFIFSILMMPTVSYSLSASGTYLFVLTNFMSISLGAFIIILVKGYNFKSKMTLPVACMLLIFIVYLISGARSSSATNMMRIFLELLLVIVLPFTIVRRSIKSTNDVRNMLIALAASCTVLSILACYEATKTWPIYRMIYDHYGIELGRDVQVKMRGGLMRATGPFVESTSFAVWLSFGAFVGLTGRWMFRSKLHYLLICTTLLLGLFAPQSRGAWLGLIVAFIFFQIGKGRIVAILNGFLGAAIFGSIGYTLARFIPRLSVMLGLDQSGKVGHDYRQDLLARGLEEAHKSLIFGADIDTVLLRLSDLRQGEGIIDFVNTYLYILLVSGLVGLIAFSFGIAAPIVVMWRKSMRFRKLDNYPSSVIASLLGSLMVMLVFTSLSGRTTMGLSILLGAAAALSGMKPSQMGATTASINNTGRYNLRQDVKDILASARPKPNKTL